jgi:uncharacterized membrane protein
VGFNVSEWLNLTFRWIHVFASIMWVGQTFLFTWMDRALNAEESLWMVHSGGFYIVQRQKIPKALPQQLHWFKWEAAMTWMSGLALLIVVYYTGGLMETNGVGGLPLVVLIGIAFLALTWAVYDFLWQSVFASYETLGVVVSYGLLVAVTFALTRLLDGRAAYIHVGAMLGTIMVANVWMRILPFQTKLVAAARQGLLPDMSLALRAKQRTKHNTYMVVPAVLIMISNHFPVATYGSSQNWLVLSILTLVGWFAADLLRKR